MNATDQAAFIGRIAEMREDVQTLWLGAIIDKQAYDLLQALCVIEAQQAKLDAQQQYIRRLEYISNQADMRLCDCENTMPCGMRCSWCSATKDSVVDNEWKVQQAKLDAQAKEYDKLLLEALILDDTTDDDDWISPFAASGLRGKIKAQEEEILALNAALCDEAFYREQYKEQAASIDKLRLAVVDLAAAKFYERERVAAEHAVTIKAVREALSHDQS